MDGEDRFVTSGFSEPAAAPLYFDEHFVAEQYREVGDAVERRTRVADKLAVRIAPRLEALHERVLPPTHPTAGNIAELARLVLSADGREAAAFVTELRDHGLSVELLFGELLEPTARLLGELWDGDEVDFVDVTLGLARLQALLWAFNFTQRVTTLGDARSVLMLTLPGEQHSFGVSMVEQFLAAGGWQVSSQREILPSDLATLVRTQWFAVVGIAMSNESNLDAVAAAVASVREHSRNTAVGIMVGGPAFSADPSLARRLGADGTALNGPSAVVLAQKLLDDAFAAGPTERQARPT